MIKDLVEINQETLFDEYISNEYARHSTNGIIIVSQLMKLCDCVDALETSNYISKKEHCDFVSFFHLAIIDNSTKRLMPFLSLMFRYTDDSKRADVFRRIGEMVGVPTRSFIMTI